MLIGALVFVAGCSTSAKDEARSRDPVALYAEARADMEAGNFERAIKGFERTEALATGTLLGQQAQLDLAYTYWRTDERAQALSTLDRFIRLQPSSPGIDYALYLRGMVNFNERLGLLSTLSRQDLAERDQRASRDAYQSFRQLVEQFPASRYADDARQRMVYIVNSLAEYELHVARYYYQRGAFLAAANRAQQAVSEFQTTPAAEEALYIMMQSYDRLGLIPLRDDAARVLKATFPNSKIYTYGLGNKQTPWYRLW